MKGCLFVILLAVTQFFLGLFKIAGVGDVKNWSWPTVLIPLWVWCGLYAIFLFRLATVLFKESNRQRKSLDTSEGSIEAFFRKHRAKKYKRDMEKWGTAK